jgi:hypothetical protein
MVVVEVKGMWTTVLGCIRDCGQNNLRHQRKTPLRMLAEPGNFAFDACYHLENLLTVIFRMNTRNYRFLLGYRSSAASVIRRWLRHTAIDLQIPCSTAEAMPGRLWWRVTKGLRRSSRAHRGARRGAWRNCRESWWCRRASDGGSNEEGEGGGAPRLPLGAVPSPQLRGPWTAQ